MTTIPAHPEAAGSLQSSWGISRERKYKSRVSFRHQPCLSVLLVSISLPSTRGSPRNKSAVYVPVVSSCPMYKSEVKHQHDIRHGQGDGDKDYFGELPAGMFHLPIMFTECFPPPGRVAELAEQIGKKAEYHYYGKSSNLTETAKHQRYSKR